ncbi:hypothetical protein MTO96_038126 [Rhipicephalus appendiculatus]
MLPRGRVRGSDGRAEPRHRSEVRNQGAVGLHRLRARVLRDTRRRVRVRVVAVRRVRGARVRGGSFDTLKRSMPVCGSEEVHRHRNTGLPARFALYITSAFTTGVMFKRQPSLYGVGASVLWTPRIRVYHGASRESLPAQAYWGVLSFGENLKTTCLKYAGWTTVYQLWQHLQSFRESLGDISDVAVLFFQEGELKPSVQQTVCLAFDDAAYVVGTACSLDLDTNPFAFGLEPGGDTQTSICLQTPVIVLVVTIR